MLPIIRTRLALLLWAALIVAMITAACGQPAAEAPDGARVVKSGATDLTAQDVAATQEALLTPVPASSPPSTPSGPTLTPTLMIARSASPEPTSAASIASAQRMTATATFLVTNTLGKGMALRQAPVARSG